MKICVFGLWHLGSVTSACLASVGHSVIGLDADPKIIKKLKDGKSPVYEPGLDELIRTEISNGRLCFTDSYKIALIDTKILWVTFDTPVDDKDKANINYVKDQIKTTLPFLNEGTIVLISSQLPVGTIDELENFAKSKNSIKNLHFASFPENLRLGKALDVFLKPDRVIIGVRDKHSKNFLNEVIKPITNKIEWMSVESAEMSKHAINAFLATSVTFANEIAIICEMVGADAKEVERSLKTESRIGPKAYLSPGGPFAGGTLARDIEFLNIKSQNHKLKTPLLSSVRVSNNEHKKWVRRKLLKEFNNLYNVTIAIWGLTYKPETNTLRRSLSLELCYWLICQHAKIIVYDPVVKKIPKDLLKSVDFSNSALEMLKNADALVIGTEWPEFREYAKYIIPRSKKNLVIIDANRHLQENITVKKFKYYAVGTSSRNEAV